MTVAQDYVIRRLLGLFYTNRGNRTCINRWEGERSGTRLRILQLTLFDDRNRKALESRSLADDERITFLETQLKEAKYIAEDADRKYDEVNVSDCV